MKIGIAIHNNYPSDTEVRTRKTAKTLDKEGHDVLILARGDEKDDIEYAEIERFSILGKSKIGKILSSPIPLNPLWFIWFCYQIKREDIDIIIGSEIRAGPASILAGSLLGVSTIFDLQENNPELVKQLDRETVLEYVKRSPKLHWFLERLCINLADIVWVVIQERRDDLDQQGLLSNDIRVVRNTPLLDEVDTSREMDSKFQKDEFTLIYVGHISSYRGLDKIVESIPHIIGETEDIHLSIGGDGEYLPKLKEKTKELGIEEYVTFHGWIPMEDVPEFINSGDVGLIPHSVNGFTNTTIPNKLFDYMMMGVPVLSSAMNPVQRIINETECGVVYEDDINPEQLSDIILGMKESNREVASKSGISSVNQDYNWERDSETIIKSINDVVSPHLNNSED